MIRQISDATRAFYGRSPRLMPRSRHREVMERARSEQAGQLNVLYLEGDHYEMGYQHGVLARDLIRRYREVAYEYVSTLVPFPRWMAKPALFYYAGGYWKTLPPELQDEIRGIADGAGAHPIEALVATAVWEMLLTSGCSEFAAAAPHTTDGSLIHGYNYDLMLPEHALIQPYIAAIFYKPDRGIPFVTVNTVGTVGANAGINEAGISVAWDDTHLADDELTSGIAQPVVPYIVSLRRLLQFAHSIDEAVSIVTGSLPRPLADIIIIGSAGENRAVVLETAGECHALREMENGAVWSTNCFRSPEMAPGDHRGDWRTLEADEAWKIFPRYSAYTELFASAEGTLDVQLAASFLRDPYPRERNGYVHPNPAPRATICRNITSFSMIMEPGKGRLWVSDTHVPACQGSFYAFDFSGRLRTEELDIPPTGFKDALKCAELFKKHDLPGASSVLAQAIARDGETAPLLLMKSLLLGLAGDDDGARGSASIVVNRWRNAPAGRLAAAWISGMETENAAVPFPSAIEPLIVMVPAARWLDRAVIKTAAAP